MTKRVMSVFVLVVALLVVATPVLASGPGNQNQHRSQAQEQNQEQNQSPEQNQYQHQVQSQNQEQNQNQHREGDGGQPDPLPGTQFFTLTGTIAVLGIDSISVMVHNGNRFIKPYVGQEVVVAVTGDTVYRRYTPDGCVPIGFEDLEVGDSVSVTGTVSEGAFTAQRVTVDVPCCTP